MFSLLGEVLSRFSLGEDAREHGVESGIVWGSGLVVLTGNLQLVTVTNLAQPKPRKLPDPSGTVAAAGG